MYLIINADKDSYDRKIDIILVETFSTAEMAGDELKNILSSWIVRETHDDKLLEELDYNYEEYRKRLIAIIKIKITDAINNNQCTIYYNDYDSYYIGFDENKNLTMISTGCPSDNEYCGETYQVIYV